MDEIGPSLPSALKSNRNNALFEGNTTASHSSLAQTTLGPVLPNTVKTRDSQIGPCLPPELTLHASDSELEDVEEGEDVSICPIFPPNLGGQTDSSEEDYYGPKLPKRQCVNSSKTTECASYGPTLPPSVVPNANSTSGQDTDDEDENSYGPALPPGYQTNQKDEIKTIFKGPSLPTDLLVENEQDNEEDFDSEDDVIGPMPCMNPSANVGQSVADEFNARATAMKDKLTGKDESQIPQRETWMTELPGFSKNFGMGPRTFRKKALPADADRSGWTDTPADKARKEKEKAKEKLTVKKRKPTSEEMKVSDRHKEVAAKIESYNKSERSESLMDMHTKERKRKMESDSAKPKERRPFDRDVDLQVNRFDEARKKTMMKKAAQLDDRFSHGSTDTTFL